MTDTPARQPQQCDHERVCEDMISYLQGALPKRKYATMKCKDVMQDFKCPHDTRATRTRPHIPAPGLRKDCVCFTCENYGLADDCDPDCPTLKQHQAAKAAREQVLEELLTIPIDDCDVGGACALIQKILSLRAQQEQP